MDAEDELIAATRSAAYGLAKYLEEYFGKCQDFHPECEGCMRWDAYNAIFPDQRVHWGPELTEETVDRAREAFESGKVPFVFQEVD